MGQWSWEQRKARARALGFATDYQRKQASSVTKRDALVRAGDAAGVKRHDAATAENAARRAAAADAVTRTRFGEQTSSADATVLRRAIGRAVTADRHLSAIVTVLVEPRELGRMVDVHLWAHGGYSAELFAGDVAAYGGVKPAFLHHAREVMAAAKYPDKPAAVVHVDLTASD